MIIKRLLFLLPFFSFLLGYFTCYVSFIICRQKNTLLKIRFPADALINNFVRQGKRKSPPAFLFYCSCPPASCGLAIFVSLSFSFLSPSSWTACNNIKKSGRAIRSQKLTILNPPNPKARTPEAFQSVSREIFHGWKPSRTSESRPERPFRMSEKPFRTSENRRFSEIRLKMRPKLFGAVMRPKTAVSDGWKPSFSEIRDNVRRFENGVF